MSFFIVQIIFAGLAVALLVVMGLVGRGAWRKRQAGAATPGPDLPWATEEPEPARPRLPSLKKKQAEPEPAAPPPARRRQLASFVEAEQEATEELAEAAPDEAPDAPACEPDATGPDATGPDAAAEALPESAPD